MSLRVCLLTHREAVEYERDEKLPNCSNSSHLHVSVDKAREMVYGPRPQVLKPTEQREYFKNEGHGGSTARWVGTGMRRICDIAEKTWTIIAERSQFDREGKVRGCRGMSVQQMVRGA